MSRAWSCTGGSIYSLLLVRTAVIDQACERFRSQLGGRLGQTFVVGTPRVAFDSVGRHVRTSIQTPRGTLRVRMSSQEPVGRRFSWDLHGDRELVQRFGEELPTGPEVQTAALADELCRQVQPLRHTADVLGPEAMRALGDEGAQLAPAFEAFSSHYGVPVGSLCLPGDPAPSIAYPHVTDQEVLLYAPPPFREDAHMAAYLEDLGFAVDRHHRVFAVPLPSVFLRRLGHLAAGGGLRPELRRLRATLFSASDWLMEIAAGVFPINVDGTVSRLLGRFGRRFALHRSQQEKLHTHFHALGHDMGIHTLAMHRVPAPRMRELRRLASVALRRGGRAPREAADFFENDLTRACAETWSEVDRPAAFEACFEDRFFELSAALRERVYA